MKLGEKLKELRTKHDMTQEKVAKTLNITPQSISKWEKGQSMPEIQYLIQLAQLYCISLDSMLKVDEFDFGKKLAKPSKIYQTLVSKYKDDISAGAAYLDQYLIYVLRLDESTKDYNWHCGAKEMLKGCILYIAYNLHKTNLDFNDVKSFLGQNVFVEDKQKYIINNLKDAQKEIVFCFTGIVDIPAKVTFSGYYADLKPYIVKLEQIEREY